MEIEAGKAYANGIDFISRKQGFAIQARRNVNGEIVVSKVDLQEALKEHENKIIKSWKQVLGIILISAFLTLTLHLQASFGVKLVVMIAVVWLATFGYFLVKSHQEEEYVKYRYHAAEHKAMNYVDRYHKAPRDIYAIRDTSSISYRCGTTLLAVVYVLTTLIIFSVVFLPLIWLKVIGCIFSFVIVFLLWACGYLDFFQRFVTKKPTLSELEVAYEGLLMYIHEIS